MQITVITRFIDSITREAIEIGTPLTVSEQRGTKLIRLGLAVKASPKIPSRQSKTTGAKPPKTGA